MSKTLIEKDGVSMYVSASALAEHIRLGWEVVSGALGFNGADMTVAGNPAIGSGTLETLLVRHYRISPAAVSATGIHAATNLGAEAQDVNSGITQPDFPRTLTVKGNVSGISGDVVITARNAIGETFTDTIALSGTSEVEGIAAAAQVLSIHLPAQTHTPTAQVETATAAGGITGSGNATITVTAAGMTGSPKAKSVAVLNGDTAAQWADKARQALAADADITALFAVSGETTAIVLTRKVPAANDATLNIASTNGTCTGITPAASSANTTAGVPYDTVSVGIAKKFGIPQIAGFAGCLLVKLFGGSADNGTLAVDADELEKNLFALNGTPDGSDVDLYYLA